MKARLGLSMFGLTLLLLPVAGQAAKTKATVQLRDPFPRVTMITEAPHVDFGTTANHKKQELTAKTVKGKLEVLNTRTPANWEVQLTAGDLVGSNHGVILRDAKLNALEGTSSKSSNYAELPEISEAKSPKNSVVMSSKAGNVGHFRHHYGKEHFELKIPEWGPADQYTANLTWALRSSVK
ncbi:WxL domain-containing protein [Lactiplantibacillus songbeiensis]|uniref:WxL domain-containing protein n=1 Tax=Lactiplantibacillus songbeiensis TaxID=2559920 RepID=A0ABW4C4E7_9LACO|nr:WxL domain-containing protein [Lactiplantibacillus songbeiensis]